MTHTDHQIASAAAAALDTFCQPGMSRMTTTERWGKIVRAALDAMPTTFGQAMLDDAEAEIQQLRSEIAAMPQPIGYAGAWVSGEGFLLDIDAGDLLHKTPEDAKNASDGYHIHCDLIVALVPVEDQ